MKNNKSLILVILIVTFVAIGAYVFVNLPQGQGEVISVSGTSEITTMPDYASVYILIETSDESAQDARDANSEITEDVMDALDKLNFKDSEIETQSYNIYEDYSWEDGTRNLLGYKVSNRIKITIEEYDFVASVVDSVVDEGALIQSINFEITQETENELKAQALEKATQDAKTKAEAIARGSGGKLGKVVSINAGDYHYRPYALYDMADESVSVKHAATQISPRELSVYGNVNVVYKVR